MKIRVRIVVGTVLALIGIYLLLFLKPLEPTTTGKFILTIGSMVSFFVSFALILFTVFQVINKRLEEKRVLEEKYTTLASNIIEDVKKRIKDYMHKGELTTDVLVDLGRFLVEGVYGIASKKVEEMGAERVDYKRLAKAIQKILREDKEIGNIVEGAMREYLRRR
ncbi:MAG: hypothetical protein QXX38_00860 [Candidatus Aenigmatarchaeota archaeon]